MATNLVTDKIVDNISKMITKTDLDRMKGPIKVTAVEVDAAIGFGWQIADTALEQGSISQEEFDDIVGKFMVRAVLYLSEKQLRGPEKREFTNLVAIKGAFAHSLVQVAGDAKVDLRHWQAINPDEEKVKSSSANVAPLMLSIDEQNAPDRLLKENGFKVGEDFVNEKGTPGHVFKLQFIEGHESGAPKVRLVKFDLYGVNPMSVSVPLQTFLTGWCKHKSKLTQILLTPEEDTPAIDADAIRCQAFQALKEIEAWYKPVQFMINPHSLSTTQEVDRGALKLAPFTSLSNMHMEKKSGSVQMSVGGTDVYLTGTVKPDKDLDLEKFWFVGFWWVEKVPDEGAATMRLVSQKVGKCTFPVLQNVRALKMHERLTVYRPKEVKAVMVDAQVVAEEPAPKSRRVSKAKAKGR